MRLLAGVRLTLGSEWTYPELCDLLRKHSERGMKMKTGNARCSKTRGIFKRLYAQA